MTPNHFTRRRQVLMIVVLGASLFSIGSDARGEAPIPVVGVWGGDRVNVTLSLEGGQIDYDCGSGSIDAPVRLDSRGRFTAHGSHEPHRPGPDIADRTPTKRAATYEGHMNGTMLELRVRIDGEATGHSYRLEKNRKVKLIRCL